MRELSKRCGEQDMEACKPLVEPRTNCGHGDIDACVWLGKINTVSDPVEAHYWEFISKGGNF